MTVNGNRGKISLRKKGPLLMTSWRATAQCNQRCLYCNVASTRKPASDELNTKEALHLIDEIYDFGVEWFGLKGGEPLLRKDIFELISYAKSLGLKVCLLTSGYYVKGEIYLKLVKNEVLTSVSIDGTEKTNDILRGKGSYKKAVAAIQKLSEAGILNGISAAVTTVNYKDVDHLLELAKEYDAKFVWFNHLVPAGRAKENLELVPSPEQYEWFLNHLYDLTLENEEIDVHMHCPFYARVVKQRNPSNFSDWFERFDGKCTYFAFGGYLSVIENGDLIPCFYTHLDASEPLKIGNIREMSLRQAWSEMQKSEFYTNVRDKNNLKGKCGVCEYRDICGGCRNRAYFYTGDFYGSDPACIYVPKILRDQPGNHLK